jgi:2-dehydropantoate 2-reductase
MKIIVVGGTGSMGLIFGARLAQGNDVLLFDVNQIAVDTINSQGAKITGRDGVTETITNIRATTEAASMGIAELILVFTKCYCTEDAMKAVMPSIGAKTIVLTLQNGWGNYDVISRFARANQIMVGVNYVSGTTLAPGHARQVGNPVAFIGRVGAPADEQVRSVAGVIEKAGISTTASDTIMDEVFKKLALNAATLPTAAILKMEAQKLIENEGTIRTMDDILREMVQVAVANGVKIDFEERHNYIHNLLKNAVGAKGSMLQDVEAKRKTEIDVINGAIVKMGYRAGISTPVNQTFVNIIKALESTF